MLKFSIPCDHDLAIFVSLINTLVLLVHYLTWNRKFLSHTVTVEVFNIMWPWCCLIFFSCVKQFVTAINSGSQWFRNHFVGGCVTETRNKSICQISGLESTKEFLNKCFTEKQWSLTRTGSVSFQRAIVKGEVTNFFFRGWGGVDNLLCFKEIYS